MKMEIKRSLGPNEKWYWISDHFSSTNISLILGWDFKVTSEQIEKTLLACQQEFEVFRCHMVIKETGGKSATSPLWAENFPSPKVPMKSIFVKTSLDVELLYQLAEEECFQKFDLKRERPLLRCLIIQSLSSSETALILTSPHWVVDGLSMTYLANIFCQYLQKEIQEPGFSHSVPMKNNLAPTLESLIPSQYRGWQGFIQFLLMQVKFILEEIKNKSFRFPFHVSLYERKTKFKYFECSEELSRKIFNYVKNHNKKNQESLTLTVNDLILSAFSAAISEVFQIKSSSVAIGCPINLRPSLNLSDFTQEPENILGPLVSVQLFHVKTKFLEGHLEKKKMNVPGAFLTLYPVPWLTKKTPQNSKGTFEKISKIGPGRIASTNGGRLSLPPEVKFMGVTASLNIYGNLLLQSYSFQDQKLRLTLAWIDQLFKRDEMDQLASSIIKQLSLLD